MKSQPRNAEFRYNPESFHPSIYACMHTMNKSNTMYIKKPKGERSGSVVECLTQDREDAGSSLPLPKKKAL